MAAANLTPRYVIRHAFPGIPVHEAEDMAQSGQVRTYPEGTTLCKENAIESIFYILLDGSVKVTKIMDEDEVRVMKSLEPGDFFGEMALIHNAPRAATVTTTTPATVLEINKETFDQLLQRSSVLAMAMIREVSHRLRENDEMAIGDLRLKARELADAYQQLAEGEYARREFLTTIAHELRTPLMAASGYLQAMRSGMMQGEMLNTSLETVTRNVQEIISLVNDILFLQEMDLIFWNFQPTDTAAMVSAVVEQKRPFAQRNNVTLKLSIAPNLPRLSADAKSLERAVAAVVDNAIKFSPEGGDVEIAVTYPAPNISIRVRDYGVGIPEQAKPKIFERFFHLDDVEGHLFRGVGLGLSIARQVIEQHGGEILVESELGKGSTFTVLLTTENR